MATKYKQQFDDMVASNKALFDEFTSLYDAYTEDPVSHKDAFNETGQKVLLLIQRYDNLLCARSEGSKYGKFSANLSDKFWSEVRKHYPKIDYVGMK